ncbi:hypothetical protein ILUMI_04508 [Ignelater luminosus]|uniref:Uncharacterized protein n=1 Tax=Ignelater luminosus TaxID=2038154 RepID=A0A8K0GEI2_IGNLU|nr:hypothetical protein ILUMI_04508 [Ignelater luminosus]
MLPRVRNNGLRIVPARARRLVVPDLNRHSVQPGKTSQQRPQPSPARASRPRSSWQHNGSFLLWWSVIGTLNSSWTPPCATTTTVASTTREATTTTTTTNLLSPNILENKIRTSPCKGWCLNRFFSLKQQNPYVVNISTNVNTTNDQKLLEQKFLTIISIIRNHPYFLVHSGMSLFADKGVYTDKVMRSQKHQVFSKDILEVPTEMFFPYTRNGIKDIVSKSGYFYVPYERTTYEASRSLENRNRLLQLFSSKKAFTNRFFNVNPVLYSSKFFAQRSRSIGVKKSRKVDVEEKEEDNQSIDLYENRNASSNENDTLKLKTISLDEFLGTNSRLRSRPRRSRLQVLDLLGMPKQVSLLESPNYEVENIVVGMKIKSKVPQIFVIGATDKAQDNIEKWTRSKKANNEIPDKGYLVEGKFKQKAINTLLKLMLDNYQYQNKRFVRKVIKYL